MDFAPSLAKFVAAIQKANDDYMTEKFPTLPRVIVGTDVGSRYIRIHMTDGNGHSVHSFVDKTNGNILKGGWKAPVKNGVRGSIYNENPMSGMTHNGPAYLR